MGFCDNLTEPQLPVSVKQGNKIPVGSSKSQVGVFVNHGAVAAKHWDRYCLSLCAVLEVVRQSTYSNPGLGKAPEKPRLSQDWRNVQSC